MSEVDELRERYKDDPVALRFIEEAAAAGKADAERGRKLPDYGRDGNSRRGWKAGKRERARHRSPLGREMQAAVDRAADKGLIPVNPKAPDFEMRDAEEVHAERMEKAKGRFSPAPASTEEGK